MIPDEPRDGLSQPLTETLIIRSVRDEQDADRLDAFNEKINTYNQSIMKKAKPSASE